MGAVTEEGMPHQKMRIPSFLFLLKNHNSFDMLEIFLIFVQLLGKHLNQLSN